MKPSAVFNLIRQLNELERTSSFTFVCSVVRNFEFPIPPVLELMEKEFRMLLDTRDEKSPIIPILSLRVGKFPHHNSKLRRWCCGGGRPDDEVVGAAGRQLETTSARRTSPSSAGGGSSASFQSAESSGAQDSENRNFLPRGGGGGGAQGAGRKSPLGRRTQIPHDVLRRAAGQDARALGRRTTV